MMKKMMLPGLLFLFLGVVYLPSLEEKVRLGREDSWSHLNLRFSENIRLQGGRHGYPDVVLREGEYVADEKTDMLIHFNTAPIRDDAGVYTVDASSGAVTDKMQRYGDGSAMFQRENVLFISPQEGALFAPGSDWHDFTIEFWLYPANLEEGEILFFWQGSDVRKGKVITQQVICSVRHRRLQWEFHNFFIPPDGSEYTVTVTGKTQLVPRRWKHHLLRFDSETALLEYFVDEEPEGISYASESGMEDGSLYLPSIGQFSSEAIRIGENFTGFLDELRITRDFVTDPFTHRYKKTGGALVTNLLDLGYNGSILLSISPVDSTPGDTDIRYYYYMTDVTQPLISPNDQRWNIIEPGKVINETAQGRFLQIMAKLYTDGFGTLSPVVSEIEYEYEPDFPPTTPDEVMAEGGDKEVKLSWKAVADTDAAGYLVYYGDTPGRYWGTESTLGPSPIDVGNVTEVTITELENNKLYYFSVVAYDLSSPPHYSNFSKEVSARPSTLRQ